MNSLTDQQLLRDYTERRTDAAFAELVRRHVDLVFSAALRMVRDAHLTEDVTQAVFVALAQNAHQLTDRPVLSGWLHRTAQNLAAKAVRSDVRRRAREQEAATMNELLATEPDPTWELVAPQLDAALGELSEPDRDALLLRYFERKSAREMAQTLGTSEDAAQKRVSRAVERLREFFAKRGITVGASGLALVLSANAVQAAPVGLAVTISTAAALTGTTLAATATATAIKTIAMTTLQKTIITTTVAVLAGAGIYEARQASNLRKQNQTLQQQQAPLAERLAQRQTENELLSNRVVQAKDSQALSKAQHSDLMKLRAEATRVRDLTLLELNRAKSMKTPADDPSGKTVMTEQVRSANKQAALAKGSLLKGALMLDPEQERSLNGALSKKAELQNQIYSARMSGAISDAEMRKQLEQMFADEERSIVALLDTNQQAAYEQMKKDEYARRAKNAAEQEAASMKGMLHLSQEQADAVASVLANLPYAPGSFKSDAEGVPPDAAAARQQLEAVIRALESVLPAEQLQTYRQTRLNQIGEIARETEKFYGTSGQ